MKIINIINPSVFTNLNKFISAKAYWSRSAEVRDGTPLPVAIEHALGFVKICAENGVELAVTLPISRNPNRIR